MKEKMEFLSLRQPCGHRTAEMEILWHVVSYSNQGDNLLPLSYQSPPSYLFKCIRRILSEVLSHFLNVKYSLREKFQT
jgi:hypothetical protein